MTNSENPIEQVRIAYQWNPPIFVEKNRMDTVVEMILNNKSLVYFGSKYHLISAKARAGNRSSKLAVIPDQYTHPTWLSFAFPKGK